MQTPRPEEATYLEFESHNDAIIALNIVGFAGLQRVPGFSSKELARAVGDLVEDDGVLIVDRTWQIPETSSASYTALMLASFDAASTCKKDDNCAIIIMRTPKNTPSFLFGQHWGCAQCFGKEAADEHVQKSDTTGVFVFYQRRQMAIPSSVCCVDAEIASRMIAQQITGRRELFCCHVCGGPFVTEQDGEFVVQEVAMTPCKHSFHKECAIEQIVNGVTDCPACGAEVT